MSARHLLEYAAYRLGGALVRRLPRASAHRLAVGVASRVFERGGRSTHRTLANLRIAYPDLPEERRREIGRRSFENVAVNAIDWLRSESWTSEELRARVEVRGEEHLGAALAGGRGALMLTLHLGNFEIAASVPPLWGFEFSVVGRPTGNRLLYRRIVEGRERTGTHVIDRTGALRGMIRALRQGHAVGILNDHYTRRSRGGIFAPLFGVRCLTSAGLAMVALRTGAPVIPGYTVRDGEDRFVVTWQPPLELPRTGDRKRDVEEATTRFNAALESIIRKHPEQWLWGTRRFRYSPDLDCDPYA